MRALELIDKSLRKAVKAVSKKNVEPEIKISEKIENGDYYSNAALIIAKLKSERPLDVAYQIKNELEKISELGSVVGKIEVVSPGFINFFLTQDYLVETISYINKKGDEFGKSEKMEGKKVLVEFTDPNPFKEFHIGHLYSNIVGESLSRLFESQAAEVKRVCYQGDVGLHVAKAIYGMKVLHNEMPSYSAPLAVRAQFLGRAYSNGAKKYDGDEKVKKEINELNKIIYEGLDKKINELYDKGKKWSLDYFDTIYKRLGTKFEKFYFESETGKVGLEVVREFQKKRVFEESEGAVIFPGEKYGLHNRVFINSLGLPTYEAKDLGLAIIKYKDFSFDESIIVTGNEVNEYFRVVLKALELIKPEIAKKTVHISHGMVRLPQGKMSSRTGEVITGEWLLDETVEKIRKSFPEMDEETAEKVGLSAVKFALLKSAVGRDVEFNFEQSIALEGASGPYLLYTYVRTKSVIKKSLEGKEKKQNKFAENEELEPEEANLIRHLVHFPEITETAQGRLSPNLVASYLFELAQKYNLFYQKHKIVGNQFRMELNKAAGQTLKNGLRIIGIETVEQM